MNTRPDPLRTSALVVALLCGTMGRARAHEAPETSATITLRQSGVELLVDVDTTRFLGASIHGAPRAVLTDPAFASPDAVLRVVDEANREVRATRLELDGRPLPLELVRGFGPDEVLAVLAAAPSGAHPRTRLVLRVVEQGTPRDTSARGSATVAAVTLPAAFGPSIVNLVRPDTRWVPAGERALLQLDVAEPAVPARTSPRALVPLLLLGIGFVVVASRWARRPARHARSSPSASARTA